MNKELFKIVKQYLDAKQGDAEAAKRSFFDDYPAADGQDLRLITVRVGDRFKTVRTYDIMLNDMFNAPERWEKMLSQPAAPPAASASGDAATEKSKP